MKPLLLIPIAFALLHARFISRRAAVIMSWGVLLLAGILAEPDAVYHAAPRWTGFAAVLSLVIIPEIFCRTMAWAEKGDA